MESPNTRTIFRSGRTIINLKMYCIRNMNKRNKYGGKSFCKDLGDIPCGCLRTDKPFMGVDNPRGEAYATRKRQRFMKKPNRFKGHME